MATANGEAQYKALFMQTQQAISVHEIVQDVNGKVIDYIFVDGNPSLERLYGLNMAELRGKSIRVVNPAVSDETIEALGRVALTGEPHVKEFFSVRAQRYSQVLSYSPGPGLFASIHTDITELKRAEATLREKNAILDALHRYSLEQAECRTGESFVATIVRQINEFTQAVVVAYSEYSPEKKALDVKLVHAEEELLRRFAEVVGSEAVGLQVPVDAEELAALVSRVRLREQTLAEVTNGVLPEAVSQALHEASGVQSFYVICLALDGIFYATVLLGLRDRHPPEEFLDPFTYLACISLRRIRAEEEIHHLSFHDHLTGLYNRRYLDAEIKRLDVYDQLPLSIIMADVNGLKVVNDTYGHLYGDDLLRSAALAIQTSCRPEDVVARWGGDEFLVLMPQADALATEAVAKAIVANCRAARVGDVPVSVAIGIATKIDTEQDLFTVLRTAEDAMYKNKLAEASSVRSSVLGALLRALEEKSCETQSHVLRMQEVGIKVGERLRLSDDELAKLMLVITLHDIGKINTPEEILTRAGPLSPAEWEIMKTHPQVGSRIARATIEFAHVANDILSHHERWDGNGYPQGLKGKEIPLLARITAVLDAVDVMSTGRPYKPAMSGAAIRTELRACAGKQFDPEIVDVFLAYWDAADEGRCL
ncbi:MAG: diguanylate cyclase [Selenomonadales bacterium]|nr:diguanylate cyclase [Selenomonadales bacterium]